MSTEIRFDFAHCPQLVALGDDDTDHSDKDQEDDSVASDLASVLS
jgi:hypothetical protein